ncbi:hypothetical protein PH562_16730 [Rhizobium sp. CNPSo 4062]|uniref:hypothetical protein n=1 Tax=Rhizobium sp. CNPSo 4062 TaxID=3021410 RepID=UPI0025502EB0|nr:hypothetical protein [Rhizobium sp. CNPSo 4062]MDK4703898.1 hypothetical protein [Rhizobium sp. CNPSo 4062]
MLIPLAEFRPDVADLNAPYTGELRNVLCADGSYIPAPEFQGVSSALPEKPLGWLSVRALSGDVIFFAGSATKLYILNNTTLTWSDISLAAYNANDDAPWSFGLFGSFVIAVNPNDDPQVYEIGVDVQFRDLGGSPPRAGMVKVWGDFVALMQLTGNPNRVQWSGLNNCEFWTPGSNNSDYQDFPDGGKVQSSSEATNPIIFLESAIQRATFVPGSAEIFTFLKIHDKRGAKSPFSVATRASYAFYADEGGFFQIDVDGGITPIGFEKVDRTVFRRLNVLSISKILGAVDPFYSRVYWALDFDGNGIFETIYVYDWQIGKWTTIDANVIGIFPYATQGYTLEGLDSVANLDALPFSLDSKAWQGGAPLLGGFGSDYRLGSFSGDNLEAIIVSQEAGQTDGSITRTASSQPIVDSYNVFVTIGVRMRRNEFEPINWLPEAAPSFITGRIRKRARGRYYTYRIRIPAGETWSHISGVDIDLSQSGTR